MDQAPVSFDGRVAGLSKTFDLIATSLSGIRDEMKTRVEELSATLAEAEKQWGATAKVGLAQHPYPYTQTHSHICPDAYACVYSHTCQHVKLTHTRNRTRTRTRTHRLWRGAVALPATQAAGART